MMFLIVGCVVGCGVNMVHMMLSTSGVAAEFLV